MSNTALDISVVIPSYQSATTIGGTIESLLSQETDLSYEIIVVDSSTDRTPEVISNYPQVQLIRLHRRAYSGEARNIGVERARGPIICFTDSDCVPEPRWLQKMWEAHNAWDCIAVGGAVENGNPDSLVSWASYITEFSRYMPVGGRRYQVGCATCNTSYKAWAFREYGSFDQWLKKYVDYAFNSRLHRAGERLMFDPTILVKHQHRVALRRYLAHELSRGRSAVVVRRMGLLPGGRIVRWRGLSAAVAPLLLARRIVADSRRVIRARGEVLRNFPSTFPLFLAGLAAWTGGFAFESIKPNKDHRQLSEQLSSSEQTAEVVNG